MADTLGVGWEEITIAPFNEIIDKMRSVSQQNRRDLLALCERLETKELMQNLPLRIAVVRVVAALLPLSLPLLTRWLQSRRLQEIHFTAFCYIDWVGALPEGDNRRSAVLKLVKDYLMGTDSEAASAAWMAGDLLGDHWPIAEALPVLMNILRQGRYVAGRRAALHGVEMILKQPELTPNNRETLIAFLEKVTRSDRSRHLQSTARSIITGQGI